MNSRIVVKLGKNYVLNEEDFKVSRCKHEIERDFVGIKSPLNKQGYASGLFYGMLSYRQPRQSHETCYEGLREDGLNTISEILDPENQEKISWNLSMTNFKNNKFKYLKDIATKLGQPEIRDLTEEIINTINSEGCTKEIRNKLVEADLHGIFYKTASLALQVCTEKLENVYTGVMDTHIKNFITKLKESGYEVDIDEKILNPKRALWKNPYKACENFMGEIAEDHGLSTGEFTRAVWCKETGQNKLV